jgi:cytidylate kinase
MIGANLDRCLSFINSQTSGHPRPREALAVRRAVTISRMAGCGAVHVAEKLAGILEQHAPTPGVKWTVFDRQLMLKVLEDHNLPTHLAKFLPEDRVSFIHDTLADIFHVHPTSDQMVKLISETVMQLAEVGNVIIVGRGANMVTAQMPHVLHVRLVADLDERIERVCREYNKTPGEARHYCMEEDPARTRYIRTYFKADIDNPLLYHMVFNTSRMDYEQTALLIANALLRMP